MPYNETTTRRPDGSKTVRKEHTDPTTGKCTKIEITDYPSTSVDFSVMNSYTKQPKTTIIIPEDDSTNGDNEQDGGFHSTTYSTIGKTTVGKTQIKTVPSAAIPTPTSTPLKVRVPTVEQATSGTAKKDSGGGDNKAASVPEQSLPTLSSSPNNSPTTTTAADGGCGCVIQ